MTRILLISTYDLGRQPFGLASPAAWLREAGADVRCLDLAVEPLDPDAVRRADAIAFFLPMHTATRLAVAAWERMRPLAKGARLAFYGLYAGMNEPYLRSLGAEAVMGGEFEPALVRWAMGSRGAPAPSAVAQAEAVAPGTISHERLRFRVPDRSGLPPLERYAHFHDAGGEPRTVGYTEATRGCKHRCRHCPVVPVYGGRFRVVPRDVVLEDVRRQIEAGARHVTFGDPDFWNGIGHAMPLVRALHAEHPGVTYDVTIKISHLLEHSDHLGALRETGCALVTSAVESVDDRVLERLDKGHTRADFIEAVRRCRAAGLALQPTFVAFHPWLTAGDYGDLLDQIERLDLIENVAPIQLAIRLLIPAGSRLLELEEVRRLVTRFDPSALLHPWRHPNPRVDALQAEAEATVRAGLAAGEGRAVIFDRLRARAEAAARDGTGVREAGGTPEVRRAFQSAPLTRVPRAPVPYLSEPWYC